ncbi:MAG: carboxypeptidase regulatory-like domain-containing protein [Candidatus Eisenbacteria bacterium]|nr:carboxypeptidase regulatory-like domain-containing protein [Candidatus Eisenbacteria bacterium]
MNCRPVFVWVLALLVCAAACVDCENDENGAVFEQGWIVAGTVADSLSGAPLQGVQVRGVTMSFAADTTDALGRYTLVWDFTLTGDLRFSRDGYRARVISLEEGACDSVARLKCYRDVLLVPEG